VIDPLEWAIAQRIMRFGEKVDKAEYDDARDVAIEVVTITKEIIAMVRQDAKRDK
jgi:hypothetical protein